MNIKEAVANLRGIGEHRVAARIEKAVKYGARVEVGETPLSVDPQFSVDVTQTEESETFGVLLHLLSDAFPEGDIRDYVGAEPLTMNLTVGGKSPEEVKARVEQALAKGSTTASIVVRGAPARGGVEGKTVSQLESAFEEAVRGAYKQEFGEEVDWDFIHSDEAGDKGEFLENVLRGMYKQFSPELWAKFYESLTDENNHTYRENLEYSSVLSEYVPESLRE